MRLILALLVLVVTADAADAGPLLNWLRDRRGGCQSCPQQSYAPQQQQTVYSNGVTYTLVGGSCANGSCPLPQRPVIAPQVVLPGSNGPAK